ncbi:hypothetical protein Fmac_016745 [Flemingia macrophylla]|uniref:Uncharacterized protein n=1 Tax=Flemingia macrophylla TaxID=520843 RepID=A0ABD1MIA5_9FABA
MGNSIGEMFHTGVKDMCCFYGLDVNHVAEFSYKPPNDFTIRLFIVADEEIMYPAVNHQHTYGIR